MDQRWCHACFLLLFLSTEPQNADVFLPPGAEFIDEHPGGSKILKRMAGKDSTKQFWKYHGKNVLEKYGPKLKIGTVKEEAKL